MATEQEVLAVVTNHVNLALKELERYPDVDTRFTCTVWNILNDVLYILVNKIERRDGNVG